MKLNIVIQHVTTSKQDFMVNFKIYKSKIFHDNTHLGLNFQPHNENQKLFIQSSFWKILNKFKNIYPKILNKISVLQEENLPLKSLSFVDSFFFQNIIQSLYYQ